MPTSRITKLRFPDGDKEYRSVSLSLQVGAVVFARGGEWVVASVSDGVATLVAPQNGGSPSRESRGRLGGRD